MGQPFFAHVKAARSPASLTAMKMEAQMDFMKNRRDVLRCGIAHHAACCKGLPMGNIDRATKLLPKQLTCYQCFTADKSLGVKESVIGDFACVNFSAPHPSGGRLE
ncbi:unnamed protein product [Heligmosomoides polygyrus]|uniref:Proline dipeptidase n=1 Tax=Heligmosomoides polygyrus TaxID=6339 RepID=A0A183FKH1_HELPZ|nr:unnamed protein product [Heligmosomoides polygyrus]